MTDKILSETKISNLYPIISKNKSLKCDQQTVLISRKIQEFYETKKLFDINLIVGINTSKFRAHRMILSASSEFFLDEFTRNPETSCIEINEIDESVMERILGFMYTSSIDLCSYSVESILQAAVRFKMHTLIEACSAFMEEEINIDNCLYFASIAWNNNKQRLLKKSLALAHLHFEKIRTGSGFLQLSNELLLNYLSSNFLCVDSEESVIESLLAWVNFDSENREAYLSKLLNIVRFELLDPCSLAKIRKWVCGIPQCDDVIFDWMQWHLETQSQNIKPNIRPRNMTHTYSLLCGESTDDWNVVTYDAVLDSWSSANLPICPKKRKFFKSIVCQNKRIIVAGRVNKEITATVECLDLQTQTWSTLPSIKEARLGHALVVLKGDMFVIGGSNNNNTPLKSVERYQFNTRSWSYVRPLPSPIAYSHRYAVVNGQLFLVDFSRPKTLKCFDSMLFEWDELEFDHDVEKVFDMAAIGGDLYACLLNENVISIERYSCAANIWTRLPSADIERFMSPRFFAFSDKLIFWGKASDKSGTILVEMYDPALGYFTPLTPLKELLYDLNIK